MRVRTGMQGDTTPVCAERSDRVYVYSESKKSHSVSMHSPARRPSVGISENFKPVRSNTPLAAACSNSKCVCDREDVCMWRWEGVVGLTSRRWTLHLSAAPAATIDTTAPSAAIPVGGKTGDMEEGETLGCRRRERHENHRRRAAGRRKDEIGRQRRVGDKGEEVQVHTAVSCWISGTGSQVLHQWLRCAG